eukprot:3099943-Lingulodinium_polyedra.AAC.1
MSYGKSESGRRSTRPPHPGLAGPSIGLLGGYNGGMPSELGRAPFQRPSVGSPATASNEGLSPLLGSINAASHILRLLAGGATCSAQLRNASAR